MSKAGHLEEPRRVVLIAEKEDMKKQVVLNWSGIPLAGAHEEDEMVVVEEGTVEVEEVLAAEIVVHMRQRSGQQTLHIFLRAEAQGGTKKS